MKIYVAKNTEINPDNGDPEVFVLGTYSTKEKALATLERQAKEDLNAFEDEDKENFIRSDNGHGFVVTDEYYTFEYVIEVFNLDDKKEEE